MVRERWGENIIFEKSGENDFGSWITVIFLCVRVLKTDKFVASIECPKARSVSASAVLHSLIFLPGPLSFAYCCINTVSLVYTISDICAIGLLF